jgi:exodeoxyribonuclease III
MLHKEKIASETLKEWILEWSRKGSTTDKQVWERFIARFIPSIEITTSTTAQNCHMTWPQTIEKPEKKEVETIVVWNGNGARARWTGKAELKELVQTSDPDVLCFLEGKTDIEHLRRLERFEEWIERVGYKHLHCYWSKKDSATHSYGNEGIILFSKVKCEKVRYGIGHHEFDMQARVLTAEFSDCTIVFSYNPQGGFSEESLDYRSRWEKAFGDYLEKTVAEARVKNKKLIWAGDFNVNPYTTDWTEKAFERIRHRIPKDTLMAGCREEDQKTYRELVAKMNGVNLAEHFGKAHKRTCFVTEKCWRSNDGQRIDHIIAEKDLLEDSNPVRIKAFDTLHQFGGSRKGSSDHCPLWCHLERGKKEKHVAIVEEMRINEQFLNADILKRIEELAKPPPIPLFEEIEMSEAFRDEDSDDDDLECEDICGIEEEDLKRRPYEDCPMPLLTCALHLESGEVKMLIDWI